MNLNRKSLALVSVLAACMVVASCARAPVSRHGTDVLAYAVEDAADMPARHLPVFMVENGTEGYNRIGTPGARIGDDGNEVIAVDPETATIYAETRPFNTARGTYTNVIYRVHFPGVPLSFSPFYIGSGKNVGVIVAVTLNSQGLPVLYTTVQSCGCYLAFIPTSRLPLDAFPAGWNLEGQTVHGETLPGLLDVSHLPSGREQIRILIRNGSHRVKAVAVTDRGAPAGSRTEPVTLSSLGSLEALRLSDSASTSFYDRAGYVKGCVKPWERLFMSWWAFDWKVGVDKKLGRDKTDGPLFYTSLKPWARDASDMRDFPAFLAHWGWNL